MIFLPTYLNLITQDHFFVDSVIKSLPEHEMPQEKKGNIFTSCESCESLTFLFLEVVEAEKDCNEEGEVCT